jgi:hypothetical protein
MFQRSLLVKKNLKYAFGFSIIRISSLSLTKYLKYMSTETEDRRLNLPKALEVGWEDRILRETRWETAKHVEVDLRSSRLVIVFLEERGSKR